MKDIPNIIEFATDPQLLGLSISPAQEVFLRGMDGLPLKGKEQALHELQRLLTIWVAPSL